MDIRKSFRVVCKAKDLRKELEKALRLNGAVGSLSLPDCSYDYYHEFQGEKEIGRCDECHEAITTNDEAYRFDDNLIHAECLIDFMENYKV